MENIEKIIIITTIILNDRSRLPGHGLIRQNTVYHYVYVVRNTTPFVHDDRNKYVRNSIEMYGRARARLRLFVGVVGRILFFFFM